MKPPRAYTRGISPSYVACYVTPIAITIGKLPPSPGLRRGVFVGNKHLTIFLISSIYRTNLSVSPEFKYPFKLQFKWVFNRVINR